MRQTRTTTTNQAPPSSAELREQIRQTIRDASEAAREAAQNALAAEQAGGGGGRGAGPDIAPPLPPGVFTTQPPDFGRYDIPTQAVDISIAFFVMCAVMVVGWPLARAFGRRIERKGEVAAVSPAMTEQLQRIEQAVDAMAIEIERISESQRFMAKLQSAQSPERAALPADRR